MACEASQIQPFALGWRTVQRAVQVNGRRSGGPLSYTIVTKMPAVVADRGAGVTLFAVRLFV